MKKPSPSRYLEATLPNGVRVIGERIDTVASVSIGYFFHSGVIYEPAPMLGVSHIIEHMLFKGTKRRSPRDIARAFDRIGGLLNAFTAKDYCCYYGRVVGDDLPIAIDVLSDMVANSQFDAAELKRERNVILEEIKMYEDSPDELIHENLVRTLWPKAQLGLPILGTKDTVANMERKAILDIYKKQYSAGNLLVAVAGNFDWDKLLKLLDRELKHMPAGTVTPQRAAPHGKPRVSVAHKDIEQVHFAMGCDGVSHRDPRRHAVTLLNSAFGGGMSSRLFQEIREKRGLAYSVYSYHSAFRDTGLFVIYIGTSRNNLVAVIDRLAHEVARCRKSGLTAIELREAKAQVKGNLLIALESTTNRMNRLAMSFLYGVPLLTPEESIAPLLAVSRDEVAAVAHDLLDESQMAVSVLTPPPAIDDILANSPLSPRPTLKLHA